LGGSLSNTIFFFFSSKFSKIFNALSDSKRFKIFTIDSVDRIINIQNEKGKFNKGLVEAELDIKEKMWFFDCHFKEDPVMPGCLGLDAMWQLVGFYLGWLGNSGKGRALGVNTVKFTGEVLKNVKKATYEIDMKRIIVKEGTTVGLANGILKADGNKIYSAENLKVGLFK